MADSMDTQKEASTLFEPESPSLPTITVDAAATPLEVILSHALVFDLGQIMTTRAQSPDELLSVLPAHLDHLATSYTFATMPVHSGAPIRVKATQIVVHLSESDFNKKRRSDKHGIVAIYASSKDANKLTSIIEIAKRIMVGTWYQYTVLSRLQPKDKPKEQAVEEDIDAGEEAFQSLDLVQDEGRKKREQAKPSMIVFLSAVRVHEFEVEML